MLYVFHVDVGRMMSFDMTVALSSVENLKATIERLHNIPAANIVLLVSGGEMLMEGTQVSCYSAGTDTNPIYMFLTGDVKLPATITQTEMDLDLSDQVQRSMELPAVYETVVARAQLASRMYECARDEDRLCERLVHDQHLQQQGWSAVIANMEDVTSEFRLRWRNFSLIFDSHLAKRALHIELLQNFNIDLNKLSRIPILPGLMPLAQADFHAFDEVLNNDEGMTRSQQAQQESVIANPNAVASAPADVQASDTSDQPSTSPNKKPKMCDTQEENATETEVKTSSNEAASTSQQPQPQSTATATTTSNTSSQDSASAMRRKTQNLLQWITSKENHNALHNMCLECIGGLRKFTPELYEGFKGEICNVVKMADEGNVKEIKGLGERLMRLEEFKYKIKGMVNDQKELSTAFQQNQNRANTLRDQSILPDLCASHRSQLMVMLQNHKKIIELRRCISKAKDELGANLYTRLRRIIFIENAMSDCDNRMLFYYRSLRRSERHIDIIEQIHEAPCIYVAAVTEVVRRKIFSEEFRTWASKLCDDFDIIHSEEIKRRENFNASFEGHFLNILFPGMNDMPPAFANENPLNFDTQLPNLTKSDIDMLSSQLPDLAALINLPDMQPVIRFFVSRSGEHQKTRWEIMLKDEAMEFGSITSLALMEKPQHQRVMELQKEGGGLGGGAGAAGNSSCRTSNCDESETDTEIEFEKVPPANAGTATDTVDERKQEEEEESNTLDRSTITERLTFNNAETLTDENETTTREELEKMRESLKMLSQHSMECIRLARSNLATVRADAETYRQDLKADIQSLMGTCKMLQSQNEARELELAKEKEARKLEVDELNEKLMERQAEIEKLKEELENSSKLQMKYAELEEKMSEMRQQIEHEKETAVALAREELIHEHKTEIESLRCRFKLMTSMERSPSDMSLEKIERPISRNAAAGPDEPSIPEITLIQQQQQQLETLKTQFEADKEKAVIAAVDAERTLWQSKLMLNSESVIANVGMLKIIEDKERQLDILRDQDIMLTKENDQLKTRLDAITNEDANSWHKEKIEYLIRDKERLEKELEKTKRIVMDSSVAGLRGPPTEHAVLPRSKSSSSSHKYAVVQSLDKGDVVFVVWSTTYGQYIVVQDSTSLFFVHGESLAGLKLRLPKQRDLESPSTSSASNINSDELPIPLPYYAIGVVIDKEYCQARKDKNRYRVPCGSKFYRVKMAPVAIAQPIARVPRDRLESFSKSVSRSQSQCESQSEASCSTAAIGGGSTLEASVMQTLELTTSTAASSAMVSPMRDVVDSSTTIASSRGEDENITLLNERCRYASVSEEDELSITNTNNNTITAPQNQSVITEQPTASNNLKLDLRLSPNPTAATATSASDSSSTLIATDATQKIEGQMEATIIPVLMEPEISTTTITGGGGCATNDDSDEYRSLEGKEDEAEFGAFD